MPVLHLQARSLLLVTGAELGLQMQLQIHSQQLSSLGLRCECDPGLHAESRGTKSQILSILLSFSRASIQLLALGKGL